MKLKPSVTVVITVNNKRHSLSLIPQPWKGRYWLRYNGKMAEKMPECTISKLMEECRKIIVKGEKTMSRSADAWQQEQERDDNGMWECEFNEWMQAHENELNKKTDSRVSAKTACQTDSGLSKPF